MAWKKNRTDEIRCEDNRGEIGGWVRVTSSNQTVVGPIYSPNGTQYFLSVDDLGLIIALQAS